MQPSFFVRTVLATTVCFAALFSTAHAQLSQPKLIQEPQYGVVRDVLGMPLLIAQPKAACAPAARLIADGPCFDAAIASLKARGAAFAVVLGVQQVVSPGMTVAGEPGGGYDIYDLTAERGVIAGKKREDAVSSVRVPRECFSLPGETVRFAVSMRDGQMIAQERQLVVCGGAPRGQAPYRAEGPPIPDAPVGLNQAPQSAGPTWEPTGFRTAQGAVRTFAAPSAACSADGALRDGVCFDAAIAVMNADPSLRELDVVAAKVAVTDGAVLNTAQIEQYVLKRRRGGYKADKRWSDRYTIAAAQGCSAVSPVMFEVKGPGSVQERRRLLCGAPAAPAPMAIYEVYGKLDPIIEPGPCAPEQRLLGGGLCSSGVIRYMRANSIGSLQAVVLGRALGVGARVPKYSQQVSLGFAEVSVNPDGQTFRADRDSNYESGINRPRGCRNLDNPPQGSEGVIIVSNGWKMAQHYEWVACPVQ